MRFDDSLSTVLAADISTPFGAQAAWRQLVDLIARSRVEANRASLERLVALRGRVPRAVRVASARAAAQGAPPSALVSLFAEDHDDVAAPLLRSAKLSDADWIALLPRLGPAGRGVLRHRRDLGPAVRGALASFVADFALPVAAEAELIAVAPQPAPAPAPVQDTLPPAAPDTSFVAFADVARGLPAVAEAMRQREEGGEPGAGGAFEIPEIVARIDAFRRQREEAGLPVDSPVASRPEPGPIVRAADFSFETDARGVIHWVEGVERAPVIGISLEYGAGGAAAVDGVARGAFRRRALIESARLVIGGQSSAAGEWLITAVPGFDRASGRFTGYRGTARRPRADESVAPSTASLESLRQLVHELRTPASAIIGFAEMIEGELLGPVATPYRGYAGEIAGQARGLLGAIEDLDMAARIDARALDLRPVAVPLAPLLERIAADLTPLATIRGATIVRDIPADLAVRGDDRAVDRLLARLMSVVIAAAGRGERITVSAAVDDDDVALRFTRPAALVAVDQAGAIDAEADATAGAPPLGAAFALRLARNLARELGGRLVMGESCLTLRLHGAFAAPMGQASLR